MKTKKKKSVVLEACVQSVESALAAQDGGADRVELCDDLLEGGITPSAGAIQAARERLRIGLQVMIRPRGGDFLYSPIEFEIMRRDVEMAGRLGADGVVFGLLKAGGAVDAARTRELIDAARPMSVTFHRAFDVSRDPYEALETLIRLGVDRILTSGQEPSVFEGLDLIAGLVRAAAGRIIIMPGCGITERNVRKVITRSRAREIHVAGWVEAPSAMRHRNPRVFMGGELRPPEYSRWVTGAARIRAFRKLSSS